MEYNIEELKIKSNVYEIVLNKEGNFDKLVELKNPIATKWLNMGPYGNEKGYTIQLYYERIPNGDDFTYRMIPKELLLFSHKVV